MIKRGLMIAMLAVAQALAHGGTVITANLPTRTAIININARQDGSATSDGGSDKWFHPFSSLGAGGLLQYTIQPGTYRFRITTPTLAASQFPALTAPQLSSMYVAWTYNSPWVTDYMAWDFAAATNFALPQVLSGSSIPPVFFPGFGSAQLAFDAAVNNGYADKLALPPGGRYTGARQRRRPSRPHKR